MLASGLWTFTHGNKMFCCPFVASFSSNINMEISQKGLVGLSSSTAHPRSKVIWDILSSAAKLMLQLFSVGFALVCFI